MRWRVSFRSLITVLIILGFFAAGFWLAVRNKSHESPCQVAQEYFRDHYGEEVGCLEMQIVSDSRGQFGTVHYVTAKIDGKEVTLLITVGFRKSVRELPRPREGRK